MTERGRKAPSFFNNTSHNIMRVIGKWLKKKTMLIVCHYFFHISVVPRMYKILGDSWLESPNVHF